MEAPGPGGPHLARDGYSPLAPPGVCAACPPRTRPRGRAEARSLSSRSPGASLQRPPCPSAARPEPQAIFTRGGYCPQELAPGWQPSGPAPEPFPHHPPRPLVPTDQAGYLGHPCVAVNRAPPFQHPHDTCPREAGAPEEPRPQAPAPRRVSPAHGVASPGPYCMLSPGRQDGFLSSPRQTAHSGSQVWKPEARRKPHSQVKAVYTGPLPSGAPRRIRPLAHLPEDPGPACHTGVTAVISGQEALSAKHAPGSGRCLPRGQTPGPLPQPPERVLQAAGSGGLRPPYPSRGVTEGLQVTNGGGCLQPSSLHGPGSPHVPEAKPGLQYRKQACQQGACERSGNCTAVITAINNYTPRRRSLETLVIQPPPNYTYPSPAPGVFPPPERHPRRNPLQKAISCGAPVGNTQECRAPGSSCGAQGESHCQPSPPPPVARRPQRAHHSHGTTTGQTGLFLATHPGRQGPSSPHTQPRTQRPASREAGPGATATRRTWGQACDAWVAVRPSRQGLTVLARH